MSSLLGMADSNRRAAMSGHAQLAQLDTQTRAQNRALSDQQDAAQKQEIGSAIGMGVSAGVATGNPLVGAAVAGAGLLFSMF